MAEPGATSNNRLMFSTEEWGMVSKTQIERATVPGYTDGGLRSPRGVDTRHDERMPSKRRLDSPPWPYPATRCETPS